jgi:hypothetical protein
MSSFLSVSVYLYLGNRVLYGLLKDSLPILDILGNTMSFSLDIEREKSYIKVD